MIEQNLQLITRILKLSGYHDRGIEIIIPIIEQSMKEICEEQKDICAKEASMAWEATGNIVQVVKQILSSHLPQSK